MDQLNDEIPDSMNIDETTVSLCGVSTRVIKPQYLYADQS